MSMPPGVPPDPNAPPTTPITPPVQYPGAQPPSGGYTAPPQFNPAPPYVPAPASGFSDPLVLAPGAPFAAWFAKFQEVAKRSWKSALLITGLGVAVPRAIVVLIESLTGYGNGLSITSLSGVGSVFGTLLLGIVIALVASIGAAFVASIAWAGGTWALVQEAQTGQPANLGAAFQYGTRRAMALFPWAVIAGIAVSVASICLFLPGLYLAFAFSMFGFVGIFERGQNPISRSFSLTHKSSTIGPTIGKIAITFGIYLVWSVITGLIFGAIAVAVAFGSGSFATGIGYHYGPLYGFISALGTLVTAPAVAVVLIGLFVTYAELRANEAPLSTAQLAQELG